MTSKLKCPFCGEKLVRHWGMKSPAIYCCDNQKCKRGGVGTEQSWQALTQAKQDLEIARQALEEIKKVCDGCRWCDSNLYDPTPSDGRRIAETTNKALEQIEHKE